MYRNDKKIKIPTCAKQSSVEENITNRFPNITQERTNHITVHKRYKIKYRTNSVKVPSNLGLIIYI